MNESTRPVTGEGAFRVVLTTAPEAAPVSDRRPDGRSLASTPVLLPVLPPSAPGSNAKKLQNPPSGRRRSRARKTEVLAPAPTPLDVDTTNPSEPRPGGKLARTPVRLLEDQPLPADDFDDPPTIAIVAPDAMTIDPTPPPGPSGKVEISVELSRIIPQASARRLRVFPLYRQRGWLWVATDQANRSAIAETVGDLTGHATVMGEAPTAVVAAVLKSLYSTGRPKPVWLQIDAVEPPPPEPEPLPVEAVLPPAADSAGLDAVLLAEVLALSQAAEFWDGDTDLKNPASIAARLVDRLIAMLLALKASDAHLEPTAAEVQVRMRLDGRLLPVAQLPCGSLGAVVGRLKALGNLDVEERWAPQQARFRWEYLAPQRPVDVWVWTMPTVHGEGVVLRVIDLANQRRRVADLGLPEADLARVKRCLLSPRGLVLSCGPAASGKTTTLYAMAGELNQPNRKIVTVEDPVEYYVPGLQQTQVNPNAGLTCERIVESLLRLDPDVVLVGDIRAAAEADSTIKAALTGPLVLSSLHAGDTAGAVARLFDFGVDAGLCASALRLVVAQRLLRSICGTCLEPIDADHLQTLLSFADVDPELAIVSYTGAGCSECRNVGYRGRQAIYEVLDLTNPRLRKLVAAGDTDALRQAAIEEGMIPLSAAAFELVRLGETSLEEALRGIWLG